MSRPTFSGVKGAAIWGSINFSWVALIVAAYITSSTGLISVMYGLAFVYLLFTAAASFAGPDVVKKPSADTPPQVFDRVFDLAVFCLLLYCQFYVAAIAYFVGSVCLHSVIAEARRTKESS